MTKHMLLCAMVLSIAGVGASAQSTSPQPEPRFGGVPEAP